MPKSTIKLLLHLNLLLCLIVNLQNASAASFNINNLNAGVITEYQQDDKQGLEGKRKQRELEEQKKPQIEPIKLNSPESLSLDAEGPSFILQEVKITGNKALPSKILLQPFNKIVGQVINFADLQNALQKANKIYLDKGFTTSRLIIPPQETKDILTLEAIEGRIGQINIINDRRLSKKYLRSKIRPKRGHIFNLFDLEKSLSRLNRTGQFRLVAKVIPSQKVNASDLQIEVSEIANLVQIMPQVNNQGRETVGVVRSGASLVFNSPLGRGDRLSVYGLGADRTALAGANYTIPVNSIGTYLGAGYDFGHISTPFADRRLRGNSHLANAYLGQEVINRDNLQINLEAGLQSKESTTKLAGEKIFDTPIRGLFQRTTFNQLDKYGSTFGFVQLNEGMSILGGQSEFITLNGEINRLQRFFDLAEIIKSPKIVTQPTYFLMRAGGQMASQTLPSLEQYQIGGLRTVRGYQEGALIGDIGQYASLEYHFPLPMPTDRWNLDKRFELIAFIDEGSIKTYKGGWHRQNFLLGTGAGLRVRLTEYLNIQTDLGFPLTNKLNSGSPADARVHFSVFMGTPSFAKPWRKNKSR